MKIKSRGMIPKPAMPRFNSASFPCIVKLPSGRWLATFKASEKKGDCDFMHAVITWSDDEGFSWTTAFEPVRLPGINSVKGQSRIAYLLPLCGRKVLMLLNWVDCTELSLPYYNPTDETLKDTRIFSCFSEDNGETWSSPQLLQIDGINAPVPLTGPPLLLADGTIACQFEINKAIGDLTEWVHRSAMIFSYDGGSTWKDVVMITGEKSMYYWDQRPQVMADGKSIINFFWTLDGRNNQYINIHGRFSKDAGKHWGQLWDTGIYGQPGQPVDIGDGRLAAIEIDRSETPVITVRISRDEGRTFDEALVIYRENQQKQDSRNISMNDAWHEMVKFSVGHPNLLHLGNNELLAYYYAGTHNDFTNIEFVRLSL